MSSPARSWCSASVLALVLVTGCGSSGPAASQRTQILAAGRAPWQALNNRDGPAFCATATVALSNEVLGLNVAASSAAGPGLCEQEAARQIRSGRLAWVANAVLKEQDPRHLVRLSVSDARAMLTFRGRSVTLRQERRGRRGNGYSRGEALTITVPNKELVEVDLVRGSDRRWQLAAIKLTHHPSANINLQRGPTRVRLL
jgi:hypothetical protein